MAISISGTSSSTVYGKGDVSLKLNPFDCYRMFTLYQDWTSDDRTPIDLSSGQKMYLVFKSNNKEIRISEYNSVNDAFTVDKVNGQVLFKIDQKNAIDILALDSKVFYITRVYETTDMSGDTVISSDEEVLYTGLWADETSNTVESYTAQIKELTDLLADRNATIASLQEANAELLSQNVELASQIEDLKSSNDDLNSQITELESKVSTYESGNEYEGTVLTTGTYTNIVSSRAYTEEELQNALKTLETTSVD